MTRTIRSAGFSALIKALVDARHQKGFSQRDLAAALGCLPATVANLESGQRRIDVVELIVVSRVLGVSSVELIQLVEAETPATHRF